MNQLVKLAETMKHKTCQTCGKMVCDCPEPAKTSSSLGDFVVPAAGSLPLIGPGAAGLAQNMDSGDGGRGVALKSLLGQLAGGGLGALAGGVLGSGMLRTPRGIKGPFRGKMNTPQTRDMAKMIGGAFGAAGGGGLGMSLGGTLGAAHGRHTHKSHEKEKAKEEKSPERETTASEFQKLSSYLTKKAFAVPPAAIAAAKHFGLSALPGMAIGAATADPGEAMSGALKGGLATGTLGAGIGAAHNYAMGSAHPLAQGYQGMYNHAASAVAPHVNAVTNAVTPVLQNAASSLNQFAPYEDGKAAALHKFSALDPKTWMAGLKGLTGADRMNHLQSGMNDPAIMKALQASPQGSGLIQKMQSMANSPSNAGLSGTGAKVTVQGTPKPPAIPPVTMAAPQTPAAAPRMTQAPPVAVPGVSTGPDLWNPNEGMRASAPTRRMTPADLHMAYQQSGIQAPLQSATRLKLSAQLQKLHNYLRAA